VDKCTAILCKPLLCCNMYLRYSFHCIVNLSKGENFGPKRDEVTEQWRKLHNDELNNMHSSLNIFRVIKSRRMRRAEHVVRMGESRGVYRVLVGKNEGMRPLGRPRLRWEDNIKMDLQEVGYGGLDWIEMAEDRSRWRALLNAVMNLRVP